MSYGANPTRPSTVNHNFARNPSVNIARSQFNRSHGVKMDIRRAGELYPLIVDECLPGDTLNLNLTSFLRLATPKVPYMDNMFADVFFFAIPYRMLWDDFKKFMGEQANPGDSTDFMTPVVTGTATGMLRNSIYDYMGIPPQVPHQEFNALPLRAYNLTWNQWFRAQDVQPSLPVPTGPGPDAWTNYTVKRRGKRHDYFTACLPAPQKGDPIYMSFANDAPVVSTGDNKPTFNIDNQTSALFSVAAQAEVEWGSLTVGGPHAATWNNTALIAELKDLPAATINEFREAATAQQFLERDARGGTRYTEVVRNHFGVISPDARQQRAEFLGGGSFPINVTPVPSTVPNSGGNYQGDLAGFGLGSGRAGFSHSFTEHCILLGLISVRADITYQQGLDKMWTRRSRVDHYWPTFANLGEQAVLGREIYNEGRATAGAATDDDLVFGYQERWSEYRTKRSEIRGTLRSTHTTPLDNWHLAQEFENRPTLSSTFIEENPPVERVIADTSASHFIGDFYFNYICARPIPVRSDPGLLRF